MNNDNTGYLINLALKKYPKAKLIAVENFTYSADRLDMATSMNLSADQRAYKWNSDTVNAIRYVLTNKPPHFAAGLNLNKSMNYATVEKLMFGFCFFVVAIIFGFVINDIVKFVLMSAN